MTSSIIGFASRGQNVTCDACGCGTNSMRVHLAFFYEDSARDDADGPWSLVLVHWRNGKKNVKKGT